MKYDYLIVGAGFAGATFAHQLLKKNKTVLIIDKNSHIGGSSYTENVEGIEVHKYGPHIFHTNKKYIWEYINQFGEFNNFINRVKVNYNDKIYSFPINLMTMQQIWGVKNPEEAKKKINKVKVKMSNINNIEDFCLSNIGEELYKIFIKDYTKKLWGISPKKLSSEIIKRIPIRFDFNDNYFNDKYQGIPIKGYANIIKKMINGASLKLNTDYFHHKTYLDNQAKYIIYTGKIDEFFDYKFGKLEYRSIIFKTNTYNMESYQGNAVINHNSNKDKFIRCTEHKYFDYKENEKTIITKEYPIKHNNKNNPYYPINNKKNNKLFQQYKSLIKNNKNVIFAGRLGKYEYIDIDKTIEKSLNYF